MTESVDAREKRQSPRLRCAGEAEIVVPGSGLRYAGRIADLSETGCFIESPCRLERGTSVEVWLNPEGLPLRVAANLLARRSNGVAMRFHSVSSRRLAQIRSLIAEIAALNQRESQAQHGSFGQEPGDPTPDEAGSTLSQSRSEAHPENIDGDGHSRAQGRGAAGRQLWSHLVRHIRLLFGPRRFA
jgi:hypothetical protein